MAAKIYYQEDCNLSLLDGKTIAIIGYGSQGHAHALNLKESGCNVIIGLYEGSKSWAKAEQQGFEAKLRGRQHVNVRTWFQHPLRMYRTSKGCRCYHDRTKGTGSYRSFRVSGRKRNTLLSSSRAGCNRKSIRYGISICTGNRWSKSRCS